MIERPLPEEYPAYADAYIALVRTTDVLRLLEELQDSSYQLFSGLSESVGEHSYAAGKWSVKQVLGHMADTERTFGYRAMSFARGAAELPGFDQDSFVEQTDFNSITMVGLADSFRAVRESNLLLYRSFRSGDLLRSGIANGHPVSVRALVYMTAGHELHHLNLLKERYL